VNPLEKQRRVARHLLNQKKLIQEHGWMVAGVFPTKPEDGNFFAYTIGLTDAGLPELIMSGNLGVENLQKLLNSAAFKHLENEIKPGDTVDDIANFPFKAALCGPDVPVFQVYNHYSRKKVRVIQLIWCDKEGNFPPDWEFADRPEVQELW
jgi:hypothetical protein